MVRVVFFWRVFLLALGLGVLFLTAGKAQDATPTKAPVDSPMDAKAALEKQTFALINQYRKENNLPELKWSDDITKIARGHSKDMATGEVDFGHDGFGKRVSQIKDAMPGLKGAGENVLKTDDPKDVAKAAVIIWLNSPHHLANIRGDFNYSGLGVWEDAQGTIYFTQVFVKIVPQEKAAAEATAPPPKVVTPFTFLADPKTR